MVLRLGPVPVLTPVEVLGVGRRLAGWAGEVVDLGAGLPGRIDALLDEVTRLLSVLDATTHRLDGLLARADTLVADVDGVISEARGITTGADEVVVSARKITIGADEVVGSARSITAGASEVVESASTASTAASRLLDLYRPMLERGAPLAQHFVDELSDEEVESAIKLVDQLPQLTEHMVSDIMPILETFDRVGPDLHELLETTKELRQAIDGIPGLSFLKRRGARDDDE